MNEGTEPVLEETPANWRAAFTSLVASRIAIFEHEAKAAVRSFGKSAVFALATMLLLACFWLLALAALIGWISSATALAWYAIAGIAAGIHLLASIVLLFLLTSSRKPSFELTRGEFRKDRTWLDNLHPPKSND